MKETRKERRQRIKNMTSDERKLKHRYPKAIFYGIILLLLIIWTKALWLAIFYLFIVDFYFTRKVNWTFWKKPDKPISTLASWIDALVFAGIAAMLIRTLTIEAYKIPTGSMEKTLQVGDYLFVSKYHYGPRLPITPLAVPFVHHTLPGTKDTPSFVDWIQCKYKRLSGLKNVERNDIVVFNFPVGDTALSKAQATSYYEIRRQLKRENTELDLNNRLIKQQFGRLLIRPLDKKDNYVKRCVAVAGDTLTIIDGQIYVNSKPGKNFPDMQREYIVVTDQLDINPKFLEKLGINKDDQRRSHHILPGILVYMPELVKYIDKNVMKFPLTKENYEKLKALPDVLFIKQVTKFKGYKEPFIFPHTPSNYKISDTLLSYAEQTDTVLADYLKQHIGENMTNNEFASMLIQNSDSLVAENLKKYVDLAQTGSFAWNEDNFGPLVIPQKNQHISLDTNNLPLYRRIIGVYEHNKLEVRNGEIYINDSLSNSYTFKQDYYFMMGDNRHNSADSRFWGFVPEDHIVGTPLVLWLSTDKDKFLFSKIRFERMFRTTLNL